MDFCQVSETCLSFLLKSRARDGKNLKLQNFIFGWEGWRARRGEKEVVFVLAGLEVKSKREGESSWLTWADQVGQWGRIWQWWQCCQCRLHQMWEWPSWGPWHQGSGEARKRTASHNGVMMRRRSSLPCGQSWRRILCRQSGIRHSGSSLLGRWKRKDTAEVQTSASANGRILSTSTR